MPYENDFTAQTVDRGFCDRDIIGQGSGRVLNNRDVVASFLEDVLYACPSRTVHKSSVNENNGFVFLRTQFLCVHNDYLSSLAYCLFVVALASLCTTLPSWSKAGKSHLSYFGDPRAKVGRSPK